MEPDDLNAEDFERLARIAHRYYVDGRTQDEIGREFGLSRPKVQRLLERARWSGVVDIRIATPPWLSLDIESRLRDGSGSSTRSWPLGARSHSPGARRSPGALPSTSSAGWTTESWSP